MIELLNSNYQPLKTASNNFSDVFFDLFVYRADSTRIASGYVSEESIADLINLFNTGYKKPLSLIVGMHYFEGFTYGQYYALQKLSKILNSKKLGGIFISTHMKYHGKVYSFREKDNFCSIIGSSNLTKISLTKENIAERVYDTDLFIHNEKITGDIDKFITDLQNKFCTNFKDINIDDFKIVEPTNIFEDFLGVEKVSEDKRKLIMDSLTKVRFEIEIKPEEKSHLNCYFGEGRKNFGNGIILPRPWYEAEVIASKRIWSSPNYPKEKEFKVVTDDGYEFLCKTSGSNFKNFRSASDLKILGRWLKGRMENKKVLKVGEKVTAETFAKYKRNRMSLIKTSIPDTWYLDFGVKK